MLRNAAAWRGSGAKHLMEDNSEITYVKGIFMSTLFLSLTFYHSWRYLMKYADKLPSMKREQALQCGIGTGKKCDNFLKS